MALINKYTEVETLYANNVPIEYVVKSPSVDIWRHEAPAINPKRQNSAVQYDSIIFLTGFSVRPDLLL